jgi:hypothetical protein
MKAVTKNRKRAKPARSLRLTIRPDGQLPGVVELTVGKAQDAYLLTELPADFGRGFAVEKIGDGTGPPAPASRHVAYDLGKSTHNGERHGRVWQRQLSAVEEGHG